MRDCQANMVAAKYVDSHHGSQRNVAQRRKDCSVTLREPRACRSASVQSTVLNLLSALCGRKSDGDLAGSCFNDLDAGLGKCDRND